MDDFYHQTRVKCVLTVLVDTERDWMQRTVEVTGADGLTQLALVVHHPEPFRDIGPAMARTLLEIVQAVRGATGTRPPEL